nr:hypothetical transcript [Hymenolepis microstoma]
MTPAKLSINRSKLLLANIRFNGSSNNHAYFMVFTAEGKEENERIGYALEYIPSDICCIETFTKILNEWLGK